MFLRFALNRTITEEAHVRHIRLQLQDYAGGVCSFGTEEAHVPYVRT